jgi:hypothetical protein
MSPETDNKIIETPFVTFDGFNEKILTIHSYILLKG